MSHRRTCFGPLKLSCSFDQVNVVMFLNSSMFFNLIQKNLDKECHENMNTSSSRLYRLSSETVNTKCGSFTPAKAREASYFYQQDPKYRGACYNGMWLSGKPHGQ